MTKENKPKRLYIYVKDVERITGKGKAASRALIAKIKKNLGKTKETNLTVVDFCQDQGLSVDQVNLYL